MKMKAILLLLVVLTCNRFVRADDAADEGLNDDTYEKITNMIKKMMDDNATPEEDSENREVEDETGMEKRSFGAKVMLKGKATGYHWKDVTRSLPTREKVQGIYNHLGGLQYIGHSRTFDNIRQPGSHLHTTFSDRVNNEWRVEIPNRNSIITFMIPCGRSLYFNPGNVRTGSDSQTAWAQLSFTYLRGGWGHNNAVRVEFHGYKYGNEGEWNGDFERLERIFGFVAQGVDIAAKVTEIVGAVAAVAG